MDITTIILLFSTLIFILKNSIAVGTIKGHQTIRDGETITSSGGEFELGFFSPGRSTNRYLGIWYKKISNGTVVWVANRNTPITNTLGVVRVNDKGITLQTADEIIWSSNTSISMKNPVAQLLDSGNLVLRDGDRNIDNFFWQSFDYPGDNLLPGMKLGLDLVWKCYNEGMLLGLIDEVVLESNNHMQVFRVIQIGLLCVQEDPIDRPDMSQVFVMLSSKMKLAHPKKPGFFMERILQDKDHLLRNPEFSSCSRFTITSILPRQ